MKKLLALLSLTAFLAVSVNAQTAQTKSAGTKKEVTSAKTEVKSEMKSTGSACCAKPNPACCKNMKDPKNCTAEQKAACAKSSKECSANSKAGKECNHSKAEAPESKDSKSGLK